jgi:hypothetical protein
MTDEEIEAELEHLGRQWDQINDPNNALSAGEREEARQRHAERLREVVEEWDRRNP